MRSLILSLQTTVVRTATKTSRCGLCTELTTAYILLALAITTMYQAYYRKRNVLFYRNTLISRALITSFLSSLKSIDGQNLIYPSFELFNFSYQVVHFSTNKILLTSLTFAIDILNITYLFLERFLMCLPFDGKLLEHIVKFYCGTMNSPFDDKLREHSVIFFFFFLLRNHVLVCGSWFHSHFDNTTQVVTF